MMNRSGVDPRLLALLVCPIHKTPLTYNPETQQLINETAGLAYPVRDGVPILLPDEAQPLEA